MQRLLRHLVFPLSVLSAVSVVLGVWHLVLLNRPRATATVLSSHVDFVPTGGSRGYYKPAITFQYTVSGDSFVSHQFEPGEDYWALSLTGGKAAAERVIADFPVGARTTAYYNADHPSRATLHPGLPIGFVVGSLIIWMVFGLGLQRLYLRFLKKPPRGILSADPAP